MNLDHDPEMLLLALDLVKKERDAAITRAELAEAKLADCEGVQLEEGVTQAVIRAEKAEARLKKWDRAYKYLFDGLMDIRSYSITPWIVEDRAGQALKRAII